MKYILWNILFSGIESLFNSNRFGDLEMLETLQTKTGSLSFKSTKKQSQPI